MRPPSSSAVFAVVAGAGLIAGCYSRVDEIRLRLDKQEKGVLIALASAPVSANDANQGRDQWLSREELEESDGFQELSDLNTNISGCELTSRLYQRRERVHLDLRAPFEDTEELNSVLRCAAQQFEEPSVSFERRDGFLWNTFVTRFEITQRSPRCDGDEGCRERDTFIPRALILTVPGKVDEIDASLSDLVGFNVVTSQVDDDSARVETALLPAEQYRAANLGYFRGRRDQSRDDVLRVSIESSELNYNLNTMISVIGVIFGSGLLLQLARVVLFRKSASRRGSGGRAAPWKRYKSLPIRVSRPLD